MCDYSQHGLPSRLACEGELLVTYLFPTQLIGLASALDLEETERRKTEVGRAWAGFSALKRWYARDRATRPVTAVCVPPGARLRMTHIPDELKQRWALRTVEDVWFTETGEDPEQFRDAIRFGNGRLVVLQTLPEHICFMVLSLGSDDGITQLQMPAWPDDLAFATGLRS
ncbi:MAG TPA: hypothetical protein VKB88_19150 [Bryobacteraceae bacterium]|nr:hypothetical protein [Bryobacteraceae bacterium]